MDQYFIHDARKVKELPLTDPVDLVITSPPYFDMKDYGSDNQIGFGQKYDEYLGDLETVFRQCGEITKNTGSLWIVIDLLRKDGELKLLPFDIVRHIERGGWKLQDILIWEKDRTVPYTHKGEMRNIFEYILFFTKSSDFKYYRERITTSEKVKEWWRKYPERYSPDGMSPTNIWEFPIPLQGSWGKKYIRHFCPLPEALIERILNLCSDPGDIVLDPFAGTGAVLSAAHLMQRKYIGCDLNPAFKEMFHSYLESLNTSAKDSYVADEDSVKFSQSIKKLRALKFPKTLYKQLHDLGSSHTKLIKSIVAIPREDESGGLKGNKLFASQYFFIIDDSSEPSSIMEAEFYNLTKKAPLSKFGIEPEIIILSQAEVKKRLLSRTDVSLWRYDDGKVHLPGRPVDPTDLAQGVTAKFKLFPPIFSTVEIRQEDINF